ncbi:MAG: hypothetical protein NZ534_05545 [Bacteroidia bacterium]|nr:hypothetical protein [Bacteroidia bacterium]
MLGEKVAQMLFHSFRPRTFEPQVVAFAHGATPRAAVPMTAIMTAKDVVAFMKGQRDVAVQTFGNMSATFAYQKRGVAATVVEQNDLFAGGERFFDCGNQLA